MTAMVTTAPAKKERERSLFDSVLAEGLTVSKSQYVPFEKCQLQGWLLRNEQRPKSVASEEMRIGVLTHELAEAYLRNAPIGAVTAKYPASMVAEVMVGMKGLDHVVHAVDDMKVLDEETDEEVPYYEIEKQFSIDMPEVAEGFRLVGRFDLFGYKTLTYIDRDGDLETRQHAAVVEFKTSQILNDTDDTEALLYAFAAYKLTGMPVQFTRWNLRLNQKYVQRFDVWYLKMLEKHCFIPEFINYKFVVEAPQKPAFTSGPHCVYCPFIEQCTAKDFAPVTLQDDFALLEWAKALVERTQSKLKEAGKEVLANDDVAFNESKVLIPGAHLAVVASRTASYQLASRKNKKADVIQALARRGVLDKYVDSLDIKFNTEELNNEVEHMGFALKETPRLTVSIKVPDESGDGAEGEAE